MNGNASEGSEEPISEFTETEDIEKRFYFLQSKADLQTQPPSLSNTFFPSLDLIGPNESYRQSERSKMNNYHHSGRPKNYQSSEGRPFLLLAFAALRTLLVFR